MSNLLNLILILFTLHLKFQGSNRTLQPPPPLTHTWARSADPLGSWALLISWYLRRVMGLDPINMNACMQSFSVQHLHVDHGYYQIRISHYRTDNLKSVTCDLLRHIRPYKTKGAFTSEQKKVIGQHKQDSVKINNRYEHISIVTNPISDMIRNVDSVTQISSVRVTIGQDVSLVWSHFSLSWSK